jgi:pantoate kinase
MPSEAIVYVPCAVSSFFEIVDRDVDGKPLRDPLAIGARGGGFRIASGTLTRVRLAADFAVSINGHATDAPVTRAVHELATQEFAAPPTAIDHQVSPPIGCGFGTSGSGSLGAALGLGSLAGTPRTSNGLAQIAHTAEVRCLTGLGTVAGLIGGPGAAGLVVEPGAPGRARVDTIVDDYHQYVLAAIVYGPRPKPTVLSSPKYRRVINHWGRRTLTRVLEDPTVESLLRHSRRFAMETGLASRPLLDAATKLVELGAIGATPNMLGRAVHGVFRRDRRTSLARVLRRAFPRSVVLVTDLESGGPRVYAAGKVRSMSSTETTGGVLRRS